jgi:hypothetical protein
MHYGPFYERFPELAASETRTAIIQGSPYLPDGEYGLIELFCVTPGCDCRRVMLSINRPDNPTSLATISYGWESAQFYADWYGENDPVVIREMQGPILNNFAVMSPLAPALLALVQALLRDEAYVARIQRHYRMFKASVDAEARAKRARGRKRPLSKPKRRR